MRDAVEGPGPFSPLLSGYESWTLLAHPMSLKVTHPREPPGGGTHRGFWETLQDHRGQDPRLFLPPRSARVPETPMTLPLSPAPRHVTQTVA
ncbi:uncharacterized protein LOC123947357 isoform X2 [Meles meles]|uniref:uncharacterized protein LOC123947357 isoform X2 n=1 Tax=Meles meles TaxID=9662 RepID=UPI001E69F79D|nr:uncharacterized protein LOC123947357 isoform X2 [Meles meles]